MAVVRVKLGKFVRTEERRREKNRIGGIGSCGCSMATLNPFLSSSSPSLLRRPSSPSPFPSSLCFPLRHCTPTLTSTKLHSLVLASHDLSSNARFPRIQSSKVFPYPFLEFGFFGFEFIIRVVLNFGLGF